MNTSNRPDRGTGRTIAATFPNAESAKAALSQLHDAGFRNVWLGVTHGDAVSGGGTTVVSDAASQRGGMMDSLGRFFSGEGGQEQALHQVLIGRGLSDVQARRIETAVPAGAAIVTVGSENDAEESIEILQVNGGVIATDTVNASAGSVPDAGVGKAQTPTVDQARRLQLREERLLIDKQRVASGEATIRKEVVSQEQSVDVPIYHEELFIQRRPVADGQASSTPIGQGEEIRIPLSEERVDVSKRTVVTEEVEIGKRKVDGTQHVSDTVRHEELRVDDAVSGKSDPTAKRRDL